MFGNEYTGCKKYECFADVKNLAHEYGNKMPVACCALNAFFAVELYDVTSTEVVAAWNNGKISDGFHRHIIYTTDTGREYIRKGSMRFYLDDFSNIDNGMNYGGMRK